MDNVVLLTSFLIFCISIIEAGEYGIPIAYSEYNGILIKFDTQGRNTHLHQITDVPLKSKERQVLHSEESEERVIESFVPKVRPEECQYESFCEDPDYYPYSEVNTRLSEAGEQYKYIFGVDEEEQMMTDRMGKPVGSLPGIIDGKNMFLVPRNMSSVNRAIVKTHSICQSTVNIIFPRIAKNKRDQWKYVVNQGVNKVQGIAVEECKDLGKKCQYISGKNPYLIPTCEQKFSYRRLLSLSYDGSLESDLFRFPVACLCVVKSYLFS